MVDDGRWTDGRRTDGRTTEHGYTISSPCEPDGSGELIITIKHVLSDALTSAGPLGSLSGSGFNAFLGAQQMLMHRKPCFLRLGCLNNAVKC